MNIADAKAVPIELILESLGARQYRQTKPTEIWYYSHLRDEKTASLKADLKKNKAIDFGHHTGEGDGIDQCCDKWNKDRRDPQAIRDALKHISDLAGNDYKQTVTVRSQPMSKAEKQYSERYRIVKVGKIRDPRLKKVVKDRELSLNIVSEDIQQATIQDTRTKGKFNAFAWENDVGGTEWCTYDPKTCEPVLKNCIGPKGVTTWNASPREEEIDILIWWGKFDRSAWMQMTGQPKPPHELHILGNSDNMLRHVIARIREEKGRIRSIWNFSDNDDKGSGAKTCQAISDVTEELDTEEKQLDPNKSVLYKPMASYHNERYVTGKNAGKYMYKDWCLAHKCLGTELKKRCGLIECAQKVYPTSPLFRPSNGPRI